MRIGEVTVISPPGNVKEIFIRSVCQKFEILSDKFCYGRLDINDHLALHLYGISIEENDMTISLDLLSPKMLGYIFIFNWDEYRSIQTIKNVLDTLSINYSAPIIVVANVDNESKIPLSEKFNEPTGLSIDRNARFTFCNISNSESAKKAVVAIIDMLLENLL